MTSGASRASGSKRYKPAPKDREDGRERLLEAGRVLFRAGVKPEVRRHQIARQAGVTPALMSYYFGKNSSFMLAATQPVVAGAIADLVATIDSRASCEARFREIIVHLIHFARVNAFLLDVFIQAAVESKDKDAGALIHSTVEKLRSFFYEAIDAGIVAPDTNPNFLLLALWGMCRLVGGVQPFPLQLFEGQESVTDVTQAHANLILQLILRGVVPNHASDNVADKTAAEQERAT